MKRLEVVNPNHVYHVWDKVEKYLDKGLEFSGGEYNIHHIKQDLTLGKQTLLIIIDDEHNIHGAFSIEIVNYPNERVAYTTTLGGKYILEDKLWGQYEDWLRNNGVTMIRANTRKSVARLLHRKFNMESKYIVVEKKL